MNESTIATNSSTFEILNSSQDGKLESSKGIYHFVRCPDGGIRLMKLENKTNDKSYANKQSFDHQKQIIERSQSHNFRQRNNLPIFSRSQSFSKLNTEPVYVPPEQQPVPFEYPPASSEYPPEQINNNGDLMHNFVNQIEPNFESEPNFMYSFTHESARKLQKNEAEYVLKYENILASIKENSKCLKKIEIEEQKYKDFLEEEFRKAQEELNKQMALKLKFLKKKMEEKREKYEKEIRYLKEQQEDEISDFLRNQKTTIDQYKRNMKKFLN